VPLPWNLYELPPPAHRKALEKIAEKHGCRFQVQDAIREGVPLAFIEDRSSQPSTEREPALKLELQRAGLWAYWDQSDRECTCRARALRSVVYEPLTREQRREATDAGAQVCDVIKGFRPDRHCHNCGARWSEVAQG
jgi:hypothetical protein